MFNEQTRRDFIKTATALGFASLLPSSAFAQQAAGTMIKRVIPGTSEMLPVIGFGSTAAVRLIVKDGPALMTELLETMLKLGSSVIDTAPREKEIDEAFGNVLVLPQFKDKFFITTKIGLNRFLDVREVDKQGGIGQYEQTKRLFHRTPADLIFVESMTDMDLHWPSLKDWKSSGEARYIGITTSATADHERMEAFMKSDKPDFIEVNYSLLEPEAEQRILPLAQDLGIGVLINSPFNGGEYFKTVKGQTLPDWAAEFDCNSWGQFNLKYLLGQPAINTILTETTKASNMVDNLSAGLGKQPDETMRKKIKAHFDTLVKK